MTMTILEKLKLSEKTRSEMLTSPKLKMRAKIVEAIENQIAAAEADAKDEPFVLRGMRWVNDPETGERVFKEVPLKFRRWWWKDEAGKLMCDIRYGNKRIELMAKKPTIEVGEIAGLVPALQTVKEAVLAGELDRQLLAAKPVRKRGKA